MKDNFRAEQCAAYDTVPHEGKLYRWQAVYSNRNPCSLLCTPSDHSFIAELQPKVVDGTKCSPRGPDMCVNGKCMVSDFHFKRTVTLLQRTEQYADTCNDEIFIFIKPAMAVELYFSRISWFTQHLGNTIRKQPSVSK